MVIKFERRIEIDNREIQKFSREKKLYQEIKTRDDVEYTYFNINIAMFDVTDFVIFDLDFIWTSTIRNKTFYRQIQLKHWLEKKALQKCQKIMIDFQM